MNLGNPSRWSLLGPTRRRLLVAVALASVLSVHGAVEEKVVPPAPALPVFKALRLEPAQLELHDGRDQRSVIVLGVRDDGSELDLSGSVKWTVDGDSVGVDERGFVVPKSLGSAQVNYTVAGHQATLPVTVTSMDQPPVGFVRDIEPILSKSGCNAGACHGAAKGKNGFKLSLRGYDPDYDYSALIQDQSSSPR